MSLVVEGNLLSRTFLKVGACVCFLHFSFVFNRMCGLDDAGRLALVQVQGQCGSRWFPPLVVLLHVSVRATFR